MQGSVTVAVMLALGLAAPAAAQSMSSPIPSVSAGAFAATVVFHDGELFVGQPGEVGAFPLPANRPGAVHVFVPRGGEWVESATVSPTGAELGIGFGDALAVDGGLLLVGAPRAGRAGAAWVFQRTPDGSWREVTRLAPEDGEEGEGFGSAVALEDGVALISSPDRAPAGRVIAYALGQDGTWSRGAELTPAEAADGARFGSALAVADGLLAAGAPGDMISLIPDPNPPTILPGSVHIFQRDDDGWNPVADLRPADPGPGALGWAVAVRDGHVFATAPLANQFAGGAFRFAADDATGQWGQREIIAPENAPPQSLAGLSMAFSETDLFLGAPLLGGGAGGAFVFRPSDAGTWTQVQQIDFGSPFAFFGQALAAEGDVAVIGAPGEAFFEGTGHVYALDPATREWASGAELFDESGGMEAVVGGPVECQSGTARSFTCEEVDLVAFVPVQGLGGERGVIVNDIWGWTDPETGREYAIVGRNDGTAFVDVSDAANPVYLGELPLHEGAIANMWRDVKVYRDHAFVVADNAGAHGVQVFDLTQLRDVGAEPVVFEETAHYDGIYSAHNIVINEDTGFAYVVGASGGGQTCGGGLHMIDIREPGSLVFAGCFSDSNTGLASTGYSHDAQCIAYEGPDEDYAGSEICFGANENALSISDVSDKANPIAVASAAYPNSAYLHQGWVSDDHRYFYMNDELDELAGAVERTRTLVWDIADLDDPILVNEHLGSNSASDHNLYVQGDLMYQSNYTSGLRILDISDPENPEEVGYFDTVSVGEDAPGFAGSWSNYPYFQSGVIVVTSMREGLFVLKKKTTPVT
jgi:choice-of-anchor B domain-containing protein